MPKTVLKIRSFAKINWLLEVLGKRPDGFHEICTIFQTISICDTLSLSENRRIALTCDDLSIPTDNSNLIVKAAELLRKKFQLKNGAKIHLEKNIPSPGGLAGGSSNAAAALLGLAALWNLEATPFEILEIAAELGSDVPFFLFGGTALGTGRGADLMPLPDLEEKYILVITPRVESATAAAYAKLNRSDLTKTDPVSILQVCRKRVADFDLRQTTLTNDFEDVIFADAPEIKKAKDMLLDSGAVKALMSGSGASVFGIFDTELSRRTAEQAISGKTDWRMFAAATVSRKEYREAFPTECRRLFPS